MIRVWLVCTLGALLLLPSPLPAIASSTNQAVSTPSAVQVIVGRSPQPVTPDVMLARLATATVVYLGETHDSPADHQAQLEILQALHRRNPNLAIGMEMFQRPFQPALDRYLAGQLTDAELQNQTQYQQRWGFPWAFYAPILHFARDNRLPVLALNVPTEVTRKVARNGLDSLTRRDRQFIPPRAAIVLGPDPYRQRLRYIFDGFHQGKGNNSSFERFFQAQVLWDETMADRIAQFVQRNPGKLVVVLAGQGHILYGDGIPNRVARRLAPTQPNFTQVSVLLNPTPDIANPSPASDTPRKVADYFWYQGN